MKDGLKSVMTGEYLAKLSNMKIKLADRLNGGYNGERKSKNRGNSIEFSDFRDYSPGDDGSRIDWNIYGRLNKLYIRTFEEEKQASINFFIDTSASMCFGKSDAVSKLDFAKIFVASAAYISLRNSDRVTVATMNGQVPASGTGKHAVGSGGDRFAQRKLADLIAFLDGLDTANDYAIKSDTIAGLRQGASLIVSDFMLDADWRDTVNRLQSRRQDVTLVHILAREEIEIEASDKPLRLVDSESGAYKDIYVTGDIARAYKEALDRFCTGIREFCAGRGIRYRFAVSDTDTLKLIASL